MPDYRLSANAARSLAEISDYTYRQFGAQQQLQYLQRLQKRFESLSENPHQGRIRKDLSPDYLCCFEGSHTIYYKLIEGQLAIIDVLHQSMEPEQHLQP